MSTQNDDFLSALTEVRIFLAIETVFGIPLVFVVPVVFFGVWAIFQSGLLTAFVSTVCSLAALRILHRDDDRGLVIAVKNIGAPKRWLAGFGSKTTITLIHRS